MWGSLDAEGTRNGKDFDVAGVAHIDGEDIEFTAHGATWANSIDVKAQTSTAKSSSTAYDDRLLRR